MPPQVGRKEVMNSSKSCPRYHSYPRPPFGAVVLFVKPPASGVSIRTPFLLEGVATILTTYLATCLSHLLVSPAA